MIAEPIDTSMRKRRGRPAKSGSNGHKADGKAVIAQVVNNPDPTVHQSRKWYIPKEGGAAVEVDNIDHLIDLGRLSAGQRVHKLGKGWYEVYEAQPGILGLRKVVEAPA